MIFERLSILGFAGILLLLSAPAIADTVPTQDAARAGFTPPTYEYQPLPSADQLVSAEAWQTVGMNAVLVEDFPNALAAFDKAVDLSGASEPEILEQRGWVHYMAGEEEAAIADLQTAATLYLAEQQYSDYENARSMVGFLDDQLDAPAISLLPAQR
ncbi:tetratricopeptide repeat protein [Romeria aff. gracilis LEGE 07310]|uniref:Tetratricopeptide repeat protein n=1 Tax=Vasconcelosia minhoensis LEGE 07310 TaxID=915328 RepID=A0A8J7DEC6_9CYAN|nr:tetratricopeptide repeat protein [Romeria gracilis]MBE9079703.1 tetratricopeptide repeat protein [Romeria aff. gracilis LEGE 07310]